MTKGVFSLRLHTRLALQTRKTYSESSADIFRIDKHKAKAHMDILLILLAVLCIVVVGGVVYFRTANTYQAEGVKLRKEIDALMVENRRLKHELGVMTSRYEGIKVEQEKQRERELERIMPDADTTGLEYTDIMAELLRSKAVTVKDIEKVNGYKKNTNSDIPAEELLVVLDVIRQETLERAKQAAARRAGG